MKDIPGYENLYKITKYGAVFSVRRNMFLIPYIHKNGYLSAGLYKDKKVKRHSIHRLVLKTFNPLPNQDNLQVNHIDLDKTNNRLDNLEWCTKLENIAHSIETDPNFRLNKNKSGFRGVKWKTPNNKWEARIMMDKVLISLGYFDDPEQAALAYDCASVAVTNGFSMTNILSC